MHQSRCIAEGGFKTNNGPSTKDKGPMTNKEDQESSNKASQPQPTQAGRIELCQEMIEEAMKCLENNDKECVLRKIEELVRNQCHDGNMISKEIADEVRDVVYKLWKSDYGLRCRLLKMLRDSDITKTWVKKAIHVNDHYLDMWITECGIDWKTKATRSKIVEVIEDSLREKIGWSETWMCEELWRFIDVDVNEFRRHGIEPCVWLEGLEGLRSLKRPYWLGLRASDLAVKRHERSIELNLRTTNTIDAVFFPMLLNIVKTPRPEIEWGRITPGTRHATKSIALSFYVDLGPNEWPWPKSINELEKILEKFSDEELAEFVAGLIDGDGTVWCIFEGDNVYAFVEIAACRNCSKRMVPNVLKMVIAKRFSVLGNDHLRNNSVVLRFYGENAVRLLRRIVKYVHHPLRRLRSELILAYYDGRISREEFKRLYEQTEYEREKPDVKHNHGLDVLVRAAPQTHTHGGTKPNVDDALDHLRLILNSLVGLMTSLSPHVTNYLPRAYV
jgi:hypothetical protein